MKPSPGRRRHRRLQTCLASLVSVAILSGCNRSPTDLEATTRTEPRRVQATQQPFGDILADPLADLLIHQLRPRTQAWFTAQTADTTTDGLRAMSRSIRGHATDRADDQILLDALGIMAAGTLDDASAPKGAETEGVR